jgi:hypothetical protein
MIAERRLLYIIQANFAVKKVQPNLDQRISISIGNVVLIGVADESIVQGGESVTGTSNKIKALASENTGPETQHISRKRSLLLSKANDVYYDINVSKYSKEASQMIRLLTPSLGCFICFIAMNSAFYGMNFSAWRVDENVTVDWLVGWLIDWLRGLAQVLRLDAWLGSIDCDDLGMGFDIVCNSKTRINRDRYLLFFSSLWALPRMADMSTPRMADATFADTSLWPVEYDFFQVTK